MWEDVQWEKSRYKIVPYTPYIHIYENNCKEIHQTANTGYDQVVELWEIFIFFVFYIFWISNNEQVFL